MLVQLQPAAPTQQGDKMRKDFAEWFALPWGLITLPLAVVAYAVAVFALVYFRIG